MPAEGLLTLLHCVLRIVFVSLALAYSLPAQELSLQSVVTPSTIIVKDGHPVKFALHGFIEFESLAEVFPYIESQKQRWQHVKPPVDTDSLARDLLRRGIESRVISMDDERPLQALITHTAEELRQAIARVQEPLPPGYAEELLAV